MNNLGCLFGKHDWLTRHYSGRGVVQSYRKCLSCPAEETKLYEFRKGDSVWLPGKYAQEEIFDYQPVFIFAGSNATFEDAKRELVRESPDQNMMFIWVQHTETLTEMGRLRQPACYFPPDWKENPVTDDYRFTLLFTVGHL